MKYSDDYKRAVVMQYITNRIPMTEFCRLHGIDLKEFKKWYSEYCFDIRDEIRSKK